MAQIQKRLKFYWVFWKSTLSMGLSITLGITFLTLTGVPVITFWDIPLRYCMYLPAGTLLTLFYKEITHKLEYYFYYNQGVTHIELWIVSLLFSSSFYMFINLIKWI